MMKLRKFRAERIRNDLANGYVVAEVLSKFFPAQISTHSFDLAIHTKAKKDNWRQVQKFFRKYSKFGEILKQRDIDILIDPTVGISGNDSGIHVLLDVYRFLFKCKLVPKLSSWGQGEMEEKSYKSAIGGWKAEQEAILGKDGRGGGRGEQRKIELTEAEKKRVEEAQKFMGYRLVLDLLGKIAEAMAKSPKFSKNNSSSMSAKAHINVSKIFNVFDVDMTKVRSEEAERASCPLLAALSDPILSLATPRFASLCSSQDIDFDEFLKVIRKDLNIGKNLQVLGGRRKRSRRVANLTRRRPGD